MLQEQFRAYIDKVFRAMPDTKEISDFKAELMDTLIARAMDLEGEGLDEYEIYKSCIDSLGDYSDTLRVLNRNPINIIRDNKFWRNIIYSCVATLCAIVVYLSLAFAIGSWAQLAVIIFPILLLAVTILSTSNVIANNIKIKRHISTGVILSIYMSVLVIILYVILSFGMYDKSGNALISVKKTWVIFTLLPALIGGISIFTFKFLRKKTVPLAVWLYQVIAISLALYLIIAVSLWQFHPYWIVILVGVCIDSVILAVFINKKIKASSNNY